MVRNANTLTVVNYHRVDNGTRSGPDSFPPDTAVSPGAFTQQINYLQQHYNVISCDHLLTWLSGKGDLPPYSALITFDDGYYDNYSLVYPLLKSRKLPAIIFLTTDHIGSGKPLYWDYVSYCFSHSRRDKVNLSLQGPVSWRSDAERNMVMKQFTRRIKQLPEVERQRAVAELANILEVIVPEEAFFQLYLSWDQVREMSQNSIEMGSHTLRHPILTRIPLSQVEEELVRSKQKIEYEIAKPVTAFAYPNGGRADFSCEVANSVRKAGYNLAFTLAGGASTYAEVKRDPFTIRRIFLSAKDTFPRFMAKLVLGRFLSK